MRLLRTAAALLLAATAALAGSPARAAEPPGHRAQFPTGTSTAPDGRTALTDPAGRELRLRGFNLDKYAEATEDDIRSAAAHGFTLLRVAVSWTRLEPGPGRYDRAELDRLHHLLDLAERYGLLALIDFHQDVYGPRFGGGDRGVPVWATRDEGLPFVPDPDDWFAGYFQPAVQAAFRHLYDDRDLRRAQSDFYTRIARELRGHRSLLGYDLFNEPFGPIPGDPTDPADQAAGAAELERGRLAGMYRRLITAVRAADTRAWLFIEPTVLVGQGVPTELPGFDDPRPGPPRLGYAPHFYDTAVESGADWDESGGFVEAYVAAIGAYPAAHRLPVLVGEWGPPDTRRPGNTALVRRQVAAMETISSGWAMWYWCRGTGGYCALAPDGSPAPGAEPAFSPYPTALAGHLVDAVYTPADRHYRLGYTTGAASGPTVLALPAAAYPDGARVTVSGVPAARTAVEQPRPGRSGSVRITLPPTRPGTAVSVTVTPR
ncbi:cellulase family glycosylhydrolase [Kitasatospora sp. NPDC057015]|uniref:cellulase family glycosylhydrolase n=1 Tax=Kitasatospora sp. NPDC057015 TaxID=3346001 RepID=UPI00362C1E67